MRRRQWLLLGLACFGRAESRDSVRGHLVNTPGKPPAIRTASGQVIELSGDRETVAVLRDERIKDDDFEAIGTRRSDGSFEINPIHLRALFVYRGGKRLVITYWCAVCSIRSFSPGRCVCCQEETELDPRDPSLKDTDFTAERSR